MIVVHEASEGRVVVLDSLTHCDARISTLDVVVTGSFAGPLAFGFALECGVRALVAHAAGVGLDGAGIADLFRAVIQTPHSWHPQFVGGHWQS